MAVLLVLHEAYSFVILFAKNATMRLNLYKLLFVCFSWKGVTTTRVIKILTTPLFVLINFMQAETK